MLPCLISLSVYAAINNHYERIGRVSSSDHGSTDIARSRVLSVSSLSLLSTSDYQRKKKFPIGIENRGYVNCQSYWRYNQGLIKIPSGRNYGRPKKKKKKNQTLTISHCITRSAPLHLRLQLHILFYGYRTCICRPDHHIMIHEYSHTGYAVQVHTYYYDRRSLRTSIMVLILTLNGYAPRRGTGNTYPQSDPKTFWYSRVPWPIPSSTLHGCQMIQAGSNCSSHFHFTV